MSPPPREPFGRAARFTALGSVLPPLDAGFSLGAARCLYPARPAFSTHNECTACAAQVYDRRLSYQPRDGSYKPRLLSVQEGPSAVLERSGASTGAAQHEEGRSGDGGEVEINESASKENAEDEKGTAPG